MKWETNVVPSSLGMALGHLGSRAAKGGCLKVIQQNKSAQRMQGSEKQVRHALEHALPLNFTHFPLK